jgi:AcrR family transcriptional regulator
MDELAGEAGVSKRTIYRYFRSKDEIIESVLDSFCSRMGQAADKAVALQNPDEVFAHILNSFYEIGRQLINPPVLEDLRVHYPQYWRKIEEFRMAKAQIVIRTFLDEKNKAFTREIDPRIATAAVIAAIQAVLNPDFLIKNGLTFKAELPSCWSLLNTGYS